MSDVVVYEKLLPAISEKEIVALKQQYDLFRRLQQIVLEEGIDYGFPAGKRAEMQKPSLYKSGAEKLTRLFNLVPEFQLIKQVEEQDFIMYMFCCRLRTPSGQIVGEGFGSCNSREKRAWSENPWMHQNTILKMAKKRSHVDAVLTGLGASNVFTQDLEDAEEPEPAPEPEHKPERTEKATEKQIKLIYTLIDKVAKETESSKEEIVAEIKQKYNVEHARDLTREQASRLIEELQSILESVGGEGHEGHNE